jgi:transposase
LQERIAQLPPETRYTTESLLTHLGEVQERIRGIEKRMKAVFKETEEIRLLQSIPGVGFLLATVILNEVGDVNRFPSASALASYAGTTPRVKSSGGRTRMGPLRRDVNHYLKWAFSEAGNSVAVNQQVLANHHIGRLYRRVKKRKSHAVAIGAVARHLAEATYWILTKGEPYREPASKPGKPTRA